eukprot:CAMPEP_0201706262 /NCGR_PEP_ID=MMETSP0578-20130828/48210_1 /ASSEMBLY_ACC=CAM_ASM_000663 /TAXON_ID=267565 /ORGANISM="Skeletonema grethea, Strain CCMP 1804" /LENGTH=32 /DNA_ID= /DNA_START= /DNA_END= /DNA_ORIENTATION=
MDPPEENFENAFELSNYSQTSEDYDDFDQPYG